MFSASAHTQYRFPGGFHPRDCERTKALTSSAPLTPLAPSDRLILPLTQHIGAPGEPLIKKGDTVALGQIIAASKAAVSAPVHATVSGVVTDVAPCMLPTGVAVPSVILDNDHENRWDDSITPDPNAESRTPAELRERIRAGGLVGMGGAAFPTAVKLNVPQGQTADTLLINGVECEPYLTCDHRSMLENTNELLDGAKLARIILGAKNIIFGVEVNKPDAIKVIRDAIQQRGVKDAHVAELAVRYPQGGEKQLIYAATGRKVPIGALPVSVGVVVLNVSTTIQVSATLRTGKPFIERAFTVTGRVCEPKNLVVRLGTLLSDLVDACGGLQPDAVKLVLGGPMMGVALSRLQVPVTKGSSGLIALDPGEDIPDESPCIHCGRCTRVCPMKLQTTMIDMYVRRRRYESAKAAGVMNCIECGACTYVCPAKRQLTQMCRVGKRMVPLLVK
ncbi:MAG: electron transport complex subunit RsxC [Oscillospiraceae bacterium]|nr:electron transport complex subunit RsxC [Oscillospiraceae bacterium]